MRVKPFAALVPAPGLASRVASVPYDVVNTEEARALAEGNPDSFLHVIRAEIDLPADTNPYSDAVYAKSRENFDRLQADGLLVRDSEPCVYLYRQTLGGHSQTGITLVCHIDDYGQDIIRKHEKTRKVKEDDRNLELYPRGGDSGRTGRSFRPLYFIMAPSVLHRYAY